MSVDVASALVLLILLFPLGGAALNALLGPRFGRQFVNVAGTLSIFASFVVALVILAIRWSSHSYGEVKQFCERYGKPLEDAHWGEYAVIAPDGRTVLAATLHQAMASAAKELGLGTVTFRVGEIAVSGRERQRCE